MNKLIRSVCAGAAIALGGTVFLSCQDKVAGACLFSLGLISVLVFGFDLFTGKACNEEFLKKPGTLAFIWLGNFIGAALFGLMVSARPASYEAAAALCGAKLDKPFYVIIIDGIICEICIAVAVTGYKKAEGFGKYLIVVFGVMVFILCGSEHVVADMFYFAAGRFDRILEVMIFLLWTTLGNTAGGIIWWLAMKVCTREKA
ncbi:MAG: formate/nitrite transporter family protein [Lachnospiraceae bacterium]|nr:formate/nitrite transporter family protein [Lachnospiraceae bacterium]